MRGIRGLATGCVAFVVGALLVPIMATTAAASTNTVTMNLNCQSATSFGNIATSQTIGFNITVPDAVQTQSSFTARLDFPADSISSSQSGQTVDYIKNLSYKIPIPANARYDGGELSGGFNYGAGTPTVTLQGTPTSGTVLYSIPGPIQTDQQFQIPALTLHLTATGAVSSFIRLQLAGSSVNDPGFTTTAHLTSLGDAATSCFEPAPKTNWNNTQIIAIDTDAPTITLNTPADGAQYPEGAHVLANYSCDDGALGSGVASCTGDLANGAALDTSTQGDFSFTVNATDNNGNAATPVTHHYSIVPAGNDNVPPQVTITTPPNGAVYQQGATVAAAYSCLDNESGINTCSGDVANGSAINTASVGARTFTVNATDAAGNPHSLRTGYRVVPAPAQQNFTSGDVTNQIPVKCDNQFQTANKTIPVTTNTAPATAGEGTQFMWSVALGADFIPTLNNGTNLLYKFAAPANGHFVSAALTGAGSQVTGATITVNGDGTLSLAIASVTDQGTLGIGNDNFTPPPFAAVVAVDGAAGTSVTTQMAEFDVTVTPAGLPLPTTSKCTGGDPTFNGRTNPTLTSTAVVDRTPPTIALTSPTQGRVFAPGEAATLTYSCADNHGSPTCTGSAPNGSALDTTTSGAHQVSVTATDAAGNAAKKWATYFVSDPSASVAAATVVEGPGATLDFDVTLSNPSSQAVSINYATSDGSATAPADYAATAGVLTFNPGDPLTKTVSVPVVNDSVWKGDRDLTLTLVSALHASIDTATATGSIVDDDPPPVTVADATATEGPGAVLDFAVTLAGNPHSPVTVDYNTTDGTAQAPARYTATSGTLTFNPGDPLVQHVLVPLVNDSIYNEGTVVNTQTMFLGTTESNGSIAGATGTIVDDEPIPAVVNIGAATIRENDTKIRAVHIPVTLSRPATQTVTVRWATVAGTASTTSDFTGKTGTLTFKPGQILKQLSIAIKGDTTPESDESFTVHLSGQTNALLGRADGSVTITDDDHPTAAAAELSVSDNTISEGGGKPTSLVFTVTLNHPVLTGVTVQYTTQPGTAKSGLDYTAKTRSLTFQPGQTQKTIGIQIKTDFTVETDEQFTVALSNPSGATITKATGTGTIVNDD